MTPVAAFFVFVWRALDGLRKVLHLFLLLIIFLLIVAAFTPRTPIVPQQTALVLSPKGALVEQLAGDPVDRAVAELYGAGTAETLVRDLVDAIRAAKTDDRIKALVLDLSNLSGGGLPKLEEVAIAIRDFRTSGKPVVAFGESYDQAQYYLAAQADKVYLDPQGLVLIEGFGYYRMFLKDALDKLAVDVNVFKAGKYKSFTDQFSETQMSEQEREASLAWLNVLWSQYQAGITKARGLSETAVADYVTQIVPSLRDKQGNLAAVALERKLITALKSRREVEEELIAVAGKDDDNHTFQSVTHAEYLSTVRARENLAKAEGGNVGVIVASGDILGGDQPPGTIGDESMVKLIRQAREDENIKAIVLRIDSPGGSMLASEIIRRELNALKRAGKPVIASMSSVAASGGYYIAMDADEIWASPTTLTGSIGVFTVFPTMERTLDKLGLSVDGVATTQLAGSLRLDRSLDEQAREILQLSVDHAYRTFIGHVANARKKPVDAIDEVAQGRVWIGADAHKQGLVDKLGSYRDALNAAATRAKLGKDYKIQYIEPELGWRQAFAQQIRATAARLIEIVAPRTEMKNPLHQVISPIERELASIARFTNAREAYYHCFCSAR